MTHIASIHEKARRRDGRAKVRLPCKVQTREFEFSAFVINLSCGGAGISVPPGLFQFDGKKVHHLVIEDVGQFDVTFRWKTTDRMGVSFNSRDRAVAKICDFFERHNIVPDAD